MNVKRPSALVVVPMPSSRIRTEAFCTGWPPADTCPVIDSGSCAMANGANRCITPASARNKTGVRQPRKIIMRSLMVGKHDAGWRRNNSLATTPNYGLTPRTTKRGTSSFPAVFSPSSPPRFVPQHANAPLRTIPHVCATPAAMDLNFSPPATGVGFVRLTLVLSPSWPNSLSPQQYAVPSAARAHAWKLPTASDTNTGAASYACGVATAPTPCTAPQQ